MSEVGEGFDKFSPLARKYWPALVTAGLGLIFFIYGLIGFLGNSKTSNIIFEKSLSSPNLSNSASESSTLIAVDIEGEVISPGVYKLRENSIIQDVLMISQGLSESADREYVAKNINLAAKLYDGAKIYIPRIGENDINNENTISGNKDDNPMAQTNLININTASAESLDTLPGVGPVTAQKIINSRPYANPEEILSKKAVSSRVFEQIKDKITVY